MKLQASGMFGKILNRYQDRMMVRVEAAEKAAEDFVAEEKRKNEKEKEQDVTGDQPWLGPNIGLTGGSGIDESMAMFEQLTGTPAEQESAGGDDERKEKRQEFIRRLRMVISAKLSGKDLPYGF